LRSLLGTLLGQGNDPFGRLVARQSVERDPGPGRSNLDLLALFISALYELLSWRNDDLRGLAHDFRVTIPSPKATGKLRDWAAAEVLSHEALLLMREAPVKINHPDAPHQGAL
jgi:hypothetical protein